MDWYRDCNSTSHEKSSQYNLTFRFSRKGIHLLTSIARLFISVIIRPDAGQLYSTLSISIFGFYFFHIASNSSTCSENHEAERGTPKGERLAAQRPISLRMLAIFYSDR